MLVRFNFCGAAENANILVAKKFKAIIESGLIKGACMLLSDYNIEVYFNINDARVDNECCGFNDIKLVFDYEEKNKMFDKFYNELLDICMENIEREFAIYLEVVDAVEFIENKNANKICRAIKSGCLFVD